MNNIKSGMPKESPFKGKRFRTYFHFSLIAICFILIFAFFYACQSAKKPKLDYTDVDLVQYKLPADDTPVVVFETSKGTFKAVIYKDEAPKFADYFMKLVKDGYYDGTYVFAAEDGVYFMGGSKSQDGTDTDDTNKDTMDQELSKNLWPFKGALISYGDKGGSAFNKKVLSGSRILFVDTVDFTDEFKEQLDSTGGNKDVINTFKAKGGVPNFSQQYTVFGQVYDGFDVYDKICTADVVDSESLRPTEDIKFEKVYISTYGENKKDDFFDASSNSQTNSSSENSDVESSK